MTHQNSPRGDLDRCALLPNFGCRLVRLDRFSDSGLISLNVLTDLQNWELVQNMSQYERLNRVQPLK